MKTKTGLLILFLILITVTVVASMSMRSKPSPETLRAERIILSYFADKGLAVFPGTRTYPQFMKGILLGEYPELINVGSGYIKDFDEVILIINYAARHMDINELIIQGTDIPEAPIPTP